MLISSNPADLRSRHGFEEIQGRGSTKVILKKRNYFSYRRKDAIQEVLMILPMFIGFLLFTAYPIFWVLRWAFFNYDGYTIPIFIGLENFKRAFTRDPTFWFTLYNTFLLSIAKLITEMPIAIVLAVLVNNKVKGSSFFRIIFFLPSVFSIAIIGLIFSILFSAYNGIVNELLVHFGFIEKNINWFGERWLAMFVVLLVSLWSTFGLVMIYFLMGLQNIPRELYECAQIDGASGIAQFFHITIPMLAPVMQVVFMISMLGTMKMTDLILVMTNGQPGGGTEVVMTYIFKYFFQYGDATVTPSQFGYASSLTVITALFLSAITVFYLKISNRMKEVY
jgi:raffinose/stachyose/melibiose transport system permease protein